MYFSTLLQIVAAGLAAQVAADGCHTENDDIGRTCIFKDKNHWTSLVRSYCTMYDPGRMLPAGSSTGSKMLVPDGWQDTQYFWGNHRIDKGDKGNRDHLVTFQECYMDMLAIWDICPTGHGGWVDRPYGTIFAECIRI